jgi:hypothetical protein
MGVTLRHSKGERRGLARMFREPQHDTSRTKLGIFYLNFPFNAASLIAISVSGWFGCFLSVNGLG